MAIAVFTETEGLQQEMRLKSENQSDVPSSYAQLLW